jgi:hypothetical protein
MKKFKIWFQDFFSMKPKFRPYVPNQPVKEINETIVLIERIIMVLAFVACFFLF